MSELLPDMNEYYVTYKEYNSHHRQEYCIKALTSVSILNNS